MSSLSGCFISVVALRAYKEVGAEALTFFRSVIFPALQAAIGRGRQESKVGRGTSRQRSGYEISFIVPESCRRPSQGSRGLFGRPAAQGRFEPRLRSLHRFACLLRLGHRQMTLLVRLAFRVFTSRTKPYRRLIPLSASPSSSSLASRRCHARPQPRGDRLAGRSLRVLGKSPDQVLDARYSTFDNHTFHSVSSAGHLRLWQL